MRNKLSVIFFVFVVLLAGSSPLFAHHGYANYDTEKKITLKGTVTKFIWSNPHCLLMLDVTDESGNVVHWISETENPSTLSRTGWNEKSLQPGDQITLTAIGVKSGKPVARTIDIVFPDGRRLTGRVNPGTEVKVDPSTKP